MGMPSLLRKVFLVDLLQGLKVTFRYQDPKEIYTEQYPLERPQVAERYRGAPRLNVNPDTDETMCIACDLCALACPENLIVVSSERNEKTRRKELTNFTYDLSRCMFCGLCEDACPTDALELTQDFELASYTRAGMDLGPDDAGKRSATDAVSEVDVSLKSPTRHFQAGFYLPHYISVTSDISHDNAARSLCSRDGRRRPSLHNPCYGIRWIALLSAEFETGEERTSQFRARAVLVALDRGEFHGKTAYVAYRNS